MKRKQQLLLLQYMCQCSFLCVCEWGDIIVISVETRIACRFVGNSCAFAKQFLSAPWTPHICNLCILWLTRIENVCWTVKCRIYVQLVGGIGSQTPPPPPPTVKNNPTICNLHCLRARPQPTPLIVSYLRFCTDYCLIYALKLESAN